jgi:hypothetical protein
MKNRLKKLISASLFVFLVGANLLSMQGALASTIEIAEVENSVDASFDIGSILSVSSEGEGTQDHAYFGDEDGTPPMVAFILQIVNFVTKMVGVIAMLLIVVGGLMMIVSQGEEALLQKGKDTVIAAIFGIVIVMFSYIIVRFVQSLFYLPGA